MTSLEALILGIIQGITEFLPVSSDGHLQIGSAIMGLHNPEQNLGFAVLVHVATVLASLIIFRKEIASIFKGSLELRVNESNLYITKIILSAIPVIIVGLFFMKEVEQFFGGNLAITGGGLLVNSFFLFMTMLVRNKEGDITFPVSILMGFAQALAVLPGVSRSGSTLATALVCGVSREKAIRFSFLMVIFPILGKAAMDLKDLLLGNGETKMAPSVMESIGTTPLVIAFIASFITGLIACRIMISLVKKGKVHYFAYYCLLAGTVSLLAGLGVF